MLKNNLCNQGFKSSKGCVRLAILYSRTPATALYLPILEIKHDDRTGKINFLYAHKKASTFVVSLFLQVFLQ